MAVVTIFSHVNRAKEFFNKTGNIYFGIGKSTAWADEENPPVPALDTASLDEIIGYKQAEKVLLVVPDAAGEIEYRSENWREVTEANAITEEARWVYVEALLSYDELPLDDYRQIGVFSGLVKDGGVSPGQQNLLPAEVSDPGVLEVVDYRRKTSRYADQRERISFVIEF